MKITSFTDYALRTLMFLAIHNDRRCTSKEVASFYGISPHHMVKIVHKLSSHGYIRSIKGKYGGIELDKTPSQINLKKLFLVLEKDLKVVECFDPKNNTCAIYAGCGLKNILQESLTAFLDVLDHRTLEDTLPKETALKKFNMTKQA